MCSPKFLMKTFVETAAHPFRYLSFRQWCTADEKMKVPSAENPQLSNVLPLACTRSEYSIAVPASPNCRKPAF